MRKSESRCLIDDVLHKYLLYVLLSTSPNPQWVTLDLALLACSFRLFLPLLSQMFLRSNRLRAHRLPRPPPSPLTKNHLTRKRQSPRLFIHHNLLLAPRACSHRRSAALYRGVRSSSQAYPQPVPSG
ncbi:hypothetical protein KC324_g19 [Hortaea werneckii]|nr:hypothetical protein KC324_g19 [Hortaea werneckii]